MSTKSSPNYYVEGYYLLVYEDNGFYIDMLLLRYVCYKVRYVNKIMMDLHNPICTTLCPKIKIFSERIPTESAFIDKHDNYVM